MTYTQMLDKLEDLEVDLENKPGEKTNTAHYCRMQLANAIAQARELLEALSNDDGMAKPVIQPNQALRRKK